MLKNAHIWSTDAALIRAVAVARGGWEAIESDPFSSVPLEEKLRLAVELATNGEWI
jgi:hypothetical protein